MKLHKLDYSEFEGEPQEWKTVNCTFGDINLIVGKNATGKTRTLSVIMGLARLLSDVSELEWGEGKYSVDFKRDDEMISYTLEYHEGAVVNEGLVVGGKTCLTRGSGGEGEIYAVELKQDIRFQTSVNGVAAFAKRDSIQHPFLEDLYQWGKGLRRYDFGTPLGRRHFGLRRELEQEGDLDAELDLKKSQQVVRIFLKGKQEYGSQFVELIIGDMAMVDYQLEEVGVETPPGMTINIPATPLGLYVKEADRRDKTYQHSISQGMFRALSVIIQINYSLLAGEPSCILIDDIGEGLDFSRSSSLVRLMIDKVKESSTQLIMATNDRFIMNNVPLEYWIVLERRGGECIHHNYRNSKQMFDEFELTGLSNFDLFSSNYYLQDKS